MTRQIKPVFSKFLKSVWLFPCILLILLLFLTIFKISGTSIGIYHDVLFGTQQKDPDLLFGEPRAIRSDEWIFVTQMTIAQSEEDFPHINENINTGRDMSLNADVPYKEWSVFFKPQYFSFFLLPLEYAFAFKWWVILFLLVVGAYFFILRIFPGKRLLASTLSTGFALSPFVFWWYQTATIAPLFYGFFIMILGIRLIQDEKAKFIPKKFSKPLQVVLLAYLITCFALVLYPPFQIPIAISVFAFLFGYLLQNKFDNKASWKYFFKKCFTLSIALVIAITMVGLFLVTRQEAVSSLLHTIYPGSRIVESGGMDPLRVLSSHLQPQLQRDDRAANYIDNQSEASNFILLLPLLILPGLFLTYLQWKKRKVDYVYIAIQLVALIFLLHMFLPFFSEFYKIFGLHKVPHERLIIGLGFIGFLHLIYTIKALNKIKLSIKSKMAIYAYSSLCFGVLMYVGIYTRDHYPRFISNIGFIFLTSFVLSFIVFLFLYKQKLIASMVLLVFSFASVFYIHPLYRGLGPIEDRGLTKHIQQISDAKATWVALDDIYYENMPLISGEDTLSGIQLYPDLNLWRELGGSQYDPVYNRYAHVLFSSDQNMSEPIKLTAPDLFFVKFTCNDFIENNVEYALSVKKLALPCISEVDVIEYPAKKFYIYKVE